MFEIGNSLREARLRQGLDFPQVELATKVRAKYLRALEDEEFGILPAQPYVKGFLRSYAEFLGLDGQLYVDEYNSRFFGVDPFDDGGPRRPASQRVYAARGLERKAVVLALAGIAALCALVIVAWKFGDGGTGAPSVVPQQQQAPHAHGLELTGVGKGTYLEVRRNSAGGPVLLQATLAHGKVERVPGTKFWLYVRRSAGVHLSLEGKAVALPGRKNLKVVVTPTRTARAGG